MLKSSVKILKGVGEKRAVYLASLSINTLFDLISHYPRRYEDLSHPIRLRDAVNGERAVFLARVVKIDESFGKGPKRMIKITAEDDTSSIDMIFMGMKTAAHSLKKGELYWFNADIIKKSSKLTCFYPEFISYLHNPDGFGIKAVYPLTYGIKNGDIHKLMISVRDLFQNVEDAMPASLSDELGLISKSEALDKLHFPVKMEDVDIAVKKLNAEEIYIREAALLENRRARRAVDKGRKYTRVALNDLYRLFSYELTESQKSAIKEIFSDLNEPHPMKRLLYGDVGSGKTAVSIAASYVAAKSGFQVAVLVPIEALASQHFKTFSKVIKSELKIDLLTSSSDKERIYQNISSGNVDIVIGTHALLQSNVCFSKLALVIVDEEHRFGVNQKNVLSERNLSAPDVLYISATPIPRTLAKLVHADMEVSYLREIPEGRLPVSTHYVEAHEKKALLRFIKSRISEGEQAYFILPRIEGDEDGELKSVSKMHTWLKARFNNVSVEILHGKMHAEEKNRILEDFNRGIISVLVATSVIEVGIDVPNATIIVISDADNFGLAQLHQLRGRVGRGKKKSYCFVTSSNPTEEAAARIKVFTKLKSGYEIAEADLKMRGPGEIMGLKQHGIAKTEFDEDFDLYQKILAKLQTD